MKNIKLFCLKQKSLIHYSKVKAKLPLNSTKYKVPSTTIRNAFKKDRVLTF